MLVKASQVRVLNFSLAKDRSPNVSGGLPGSVRRSVHFNGGWPGVEVISTRSRLKPVFKPMHVARHN